MYGGGCAIEPFKCKGCGGCCRNIKGRIGPKLITPLPPYVFRPRDVAQMTILIRDWELPILQEKAKKLNIELHVSPHLLIWDELSQTSIAFHWQFDHDDCPFLTESNVCLVNDNKPLVCKGYPILVFNLLDSDEMIQIDTGDCPNVVAHPFDVGKRFEVAPIVVFDELYKRYGDNFLAILKSDLARRPFPEMLESLIKDWKIYPAIIDEEIKSKIISSKPQGFMDFLKETNKEAYERIVQQIKELNALDYTTLRSLAIYQTTIYNGKGML